MIGFVSTVIRSGQNLDLFLENCLIHLLMQKNHFRVTKCKKRMRLRSFRKCIKQLIHATQRQVPFTIYHCPYVYLDVILV